MEVWHVLIGFCVLVAVCLWSIKKLRKTSRTWGDELKELQEELKARGVKDLHIAWSPDAPARSTEERAKAVAAFLRAALDGRTHPAPPIGDSHGTVHVYEDAHGMRFR